MPAPAITNHSSIKIREINQISEMRSVEDLQKEVWAANDREIFPSLALVPMIEVGGVLLGAFDRAEMVGFVFAFPGLDAGRPTLHSDMLAVRPAYRSQGLGYKLKLEQRERAVAKGIERITWTFDPLQSRNAYLNFAKLGVTADRYKINYYGETSSYLHRTGTDRLWVTWLLTSERVKERLQERSTAKPYSAETPGAPVLVKVGEKDDPISDNTPLESDAIIEIPGDVNTLLSEDIELAISWREATRKAFTRALDAGFFVEEFSRLERDGRNIGRYLLRCGEGCTTITS
jgi:predicted GNAT superfamily acetyltransferase